MDTTQAHEPTVTRLARRTLVAILILWAAFYLVALARHPGAGTDFADFYAASRAAAVGDNPYNWPTQWRWENRVLNQGSGRLPIHFSFAPYGNPPPFALLLSLLSTALPPRPAYGVWTGLAFAVTVAAAAALNRWAGFAHPVPLGFLWASAPCATFGFFLGQDSWLVLAALTGALILLNRYPVLAGGALILLGFPKPHLLVPLAVILSIAAGDRRPRFGLGLFLGIVVWFILAVALEGTTALGAWLTVLTLYRQSIAAQPDIASLPGLYTAWAPPSATTVLDALLLLGAGALLVALRPRPAEGQGVNRRFLALGTATTLAVLPYTHTHDDVLLVVPLLLLMGPDWRGLDRPGVLLAVAVTVLAPLALWSDYHRPIVSVLPASCTLLACLMHQHLSPQAWPT